MIPYMNAATAANGGARPDACRHQDARFRARVRRVHALGPRPVGELLLDVSQACPAAEHIILERLERFASLDPVLILAAGADDWLQDRQLLRAVP